ncbi:MAG: sugar ABC transporter ATP-binding protein [Spirochaetes bacterium]|nr:sugar ABC transporter ATP-binding protein [Spirochaetota bacterium]MBN2771790.1 sugar ABC transporter ATP-binding protein [Spirochaetota bacterium]
MNIKKPVLCCTSITKFFSGVIALDKVNFNLFPGEIHGLLGENGAGKSTLIKCLTGVYLPDHGDIYYEGKRVVFAAPSEARNRGISTVYQEINLIQTLSVAENIFAGRQPLSKGRINWKKINERSRELLAMLDLDIDVTALLSEYSTAVQQMVAIARSLDISAKVLILDEPTSSLDEDEAHMLFNVIRKLRNEGMAIVFISHFLDQVLELCDTLTILRNGESVGEYRANEISKHELIIKMLGKKLAAFENRVAELNSSDESKKDVFYSVRSMSRRKSMKHFDLDLKKGEVLGLAGLLGSGRTEIARLLFGIDKPHSGNTVIKGVSGSVLSPKNAVRHSFGYCPEDRKLEGLIPCLTIRENIVLALQVKKGLLKYISLKKQRKIAEKFMQLVSIKAPSCEENVSRLSGGNQQKVIIARWLAANPEFLILDEPTRGIDVGAKFEIQKLILKFRDLGMSILFISSELDELVRCCDRVAVLRDRKKITEYTGRSLCSEKIMATIAHVTSEAEDGNLL